MLRQIVLDTETTGLSVATGDRIVEIGCVELLGRRATGHNLHLYFNPERDIPEEATRIHGIRNEDVHNQPTFAEKAEEIVAYLQGAELIIHNASFDTGFLDQELERAGQQPLAAHVTTIVDTLAMAKNLFPGKRNSLDALCARLEIDNTHRSLHGALLDARLLAQVYIRLTRNQETLLIEDGLDHLHGAHAGAAPAVDLRQFTLPVLRASAEELAEHEAILKAIGQR